MTKTTSWNRLSHAAFTRRWLNWQQSLTFLSVRQLGDQLKLIRFRRGVMSQHMATAMRMVVRTQGLDYVAWRHLARRYLTAMQRTALYRTQVVKEISRL